MKGKAIIYDFDDVLLDTKDTAIAAFQETARLRGLRVPEYGEFIGIWGQHVERIVIHFYPHEDVGEFVSVLTETGTNRTYTPIDGAHDTLRFTTSNGYVNGILTQRETWSLGKRARETGIDLGLFDFVYAGDTVKYRKPDTRSFDEIAEELRKRGILHEDVIYIGDSLIDHQVANANGVSFVGVLTGFTTEEEFARAGVERACILPSVKYFSDFLRRMQYPKQL